MTEYSISVNSYSDKLDIWSVESTRIQVTTLFPDEVKDSEMLRGIAAVVANKAGEIHCSHSHCTFEFSSVEFPDWMLKTESKVMIRAELVSNRTKRSTWQRYAYVFFSSRLLVAYEITIGSGEIGDDFHNFPLFPGTEYVIWVSLEIRNAANSSQLLTTPEVSLPTNVQTEDPSCSTRSFIETYEFIEVKVDIDGLDQVRTVCNISYDVVLGDEVVKSDILDENIQVRLVDTVGNGMLGNWTVDLIFWDASERYELKNVCKYSPSQLPLKPACNLSTNSSTWDTISVGVQVSNIVHRHGSKLAYCLTSIDDSGMAENRCVPSFDVHKFFNLKPASLYNISMELLLTYKGISGQSNFLTGHLCQMESATTPVPTCTASVTNTTLNTVTVHVHLLNPLPQSQFDGEIEIQVDDFAKNRQSFDTDSVEVDIHGPFQRLRHNATVWIKYKEKSIGYTNKVEGCNFTFRTNTLAGLASRSVRRGSVPIYVAVAVSMACLVMICFSLIASVFRKKHSGRMQSWKADYAVRKPVSEDKVYLYENISEDEFTPNPPLRRQKTIPKPHTIDLGGSDEAVYENSTTFKPKPLSNPIKVTDLLDFFADSIKSDPNLISKEYAELPTERQKTCIIGELYSEKNRFSNIIPYDHSRVRLEGGESDYINASFITGYGGKKYIAAQAPLESTVGEFWKTVDQQGVRVIVMLCSCKEGGRKRCHEYWPAECALTETFGNIDVKKQSEEVFPNFIVRKLLMKDTIEVTQFEFTSWPDMGVPQYGGCLVKLRSRVKEAEIIDSPILVHCKAGVGRKSHNHPPILCTCARLFRNWNVYYDRLDVGDGGERGKN